jgi:hypothetical protein
MESTLQPLQVPAKRQQVLSVDLGDLKSQWLAWCEAQGVKPSDATRQVLSRVMQKGPASDPGRAVEAQGSRDERRRRREITLTESEDRLAAVHAAAAGYSVPKWLQALVRHQLTGTPQLGADDRAALAQSNYQLLAIGRNLNQMAKALNSYTDQRSAYSAEVIHELRTYIEHHVEHVAGLLESNAERWKLL